jgi:hypothetical protein
MATVKRTYYPGVGLSLDSANVYSFTERLTITGITPGGTEAATRIAAITASGATIGTYHGTVSETYCIGIDVTMLSDTSAIVDLHYGRPGDPVLDGGWTYETWSEEVRFTTYVDINNAPIINKFYPPTAKLAEVAFFADGNNAREYKRMVSVQGYKTIVHAVGRRHISAAASAAMITAGKNPPWRWPHAYSQYVNSALTVPATPAGVWLCRGVRTITRNMEKSHLVTAEFCMNPQGWEELSIFTRRDGTRPHDITLDPGMITPWPTVRTSAAAPYGARRPQTVKGQIHFHDYPLSFDLGRFYAI